MSRPILWKELRDQRAFAWLGVVLLAIELLEVLARQFDMQPIGRHFGNQADESVAFLFLLSFAVGTGLLMREIDEGTLAFLDGLPVTRVHLFAAKLAVALPVLLVYPAGRLLILAAQHLASRNSLDHALHPHLLATALGLEAVVIFVGVSLGLLFGFLRSLAWVTFGICAMTLFAAVQKWPRLSALNPLALAEVRFIGTHWRISNEGLSVQLALAAALSLCGLALFASAAQRPGFSLGRWLRRPIVSALVGAATVVVGVLVLTLYAISDRDAAKGVANRSPDTVRFPEAPPGHARMRHYTFSYPAHDAEPLRIFLTGADAAYERVESLLGIDGGATIDVDLFGSVPNTEGTAFFERIRVNPDAGDPIATLAHETTHVFANRLAGAERERELSKMPVFNEGLARWVERHVHDDGGLSDSDRFQAAVVSKRRLVTAPMLTDLERLARSQDQNLKYPLGAVLIDALIERCGADSPRLILSALGRPDFPRNLKDLELWQTAFQLAGFDLALVFDDYATKLKALEPAYARFIEQLPRPRGVLVQREEEVGVELRFDGDVPEGWTGVVRFRPTAESPLSEYVASAALDGVAWHPTGSLANEEVCFQPGVGNGELTIFESWNCLPIDSAGELPPLSGE